MPDSSVSAADGLLIPLLLELCPGPLPPSRSYVPFQGATNAQLLSLMCMKKRPAIPTAQSIGKGEVAGFILPNPSASFTTPR